MQPTYMEEKKIDDSIVATRQQTVEFNELPVQRHAVQHGSKQLKLVGQRLFASPRLTHKGVIEIFECCDVIDCLLLRHKTSAASLYTTLNIYGENYQQRSILPSCATSTTRSTTVSSCKSYDEGVGGILANAKSSWRGINRARHHLVLFQLCSEIMAKR